MGSRTFGIIGAMDIEIALLRDHMETLADVSETRIANMTFYQGVIGGVSCVLVQCGVGMVNAAVCTQILIDEFNVAAIINTGVAGSLDAKINIGDIVVATDAVNHIMDVSNLGYECGLTPGSDTLAFPMDESLREAVLAAAKAVGVTTHEGRVASGDRFVRDESEKMRITETFGAKCCEMEGAAIANACNLSKMPCAIVRAISDKADGTSTMDYVTFESQAAHHSAALIIATLESLH